MLDFREELSKIKEDKLNRADLQERVEEILKAILAYFKSLSIEKVNSNKFKVSFYLHYTDIYKTIYIRVEDKKCYYNICNYTFSTREDARKTLEMLKEYFIKQDYKIYEDVASKFSFAIKV